MLVINAWEEAVYRRVSIPIEGPPSPGMPFPSDDYGPFMGWTVEVHIKGRRYHLLGPVREDCTADLIDIDTGDIDILRINFVKLDGTTWTPHDCGMNDDTV